MQALMSMTRPEGQPDTRLPCENSAYKLTDTWSQRSQRISENMKIEKNSSPSTEQLQETSEKLL